MLQAGTNAREVENSFHPNEYVWKKVHIHKSFHRCWKTANVKIRIRGIYLSYDAVLPLIFFLEENRKKHSLNLYTLYIHSLELQNHFSQVTYES